MSINPLDAIFQLGKSAIDKIWPDPIKRAEEIRKLEEMRQQGDLAELSAYVQLVQGQLTINAKEAEHSSIFVAGWRPFVGWVGGFSLAYAGILEPLMRFVATVMFEYTGDFPVIDTALTIQVLLGMLGIAGMRSFDKVKRTDTKSIDESKG